MVTQIGFGSGKLRIVGGPGKRFPFMIPPLGFNDTNQVSVFEGPTIVETLTLEWFIVYVLCKEKPELCPFVYEETASAAGTRDD